MDIKASQLYIPYTGETQIQKESSRLEVIPAWDKQTLSLIHEKEEELGTSFADFLAYSEDGQNILPVDSVAFRTETDEAGSTRKLSFILVGHALPLCDFSSFSSVARVEFIGHLSFITSAFKIISQLTNLTSVSFKLNKSQQPFFLEDSEDDLTILPENHSVTRLEVYADPEHADVFIMNRILDVLFSRAEVCLPSLKHLDLKLPLVPATKKIFLRILRNSVVNPCEQELSYSLPKEKSTPTLSCVYEAKTEQSMPFHILTSWNSTVMRRFPKCFGDYYNSHAAKLFLNKVFGSSDSTPWQFTKPSKKCKSPVSPSSISEGWAPSYLRVYIDLSFYEEDWELFTKIPCTENGKAFETGIETLWELGKVISELKYQQNETSKTTHIEAARRMKARRQAKICRTARLLGVGNLSHNWLYDLTNNKYPRYPMTASLKC